MLVKYRPTKSLFSPLLEEFWNQTHSDEDCTLSPRTDILEQKDNYVIYAEMPGVKKDDFKVDVEDNLLTIRGTKEVHKREDGEHFARVERQCGNYSRSFRLGEEINADKISAKYDSGVLEVVLPKSKKVKPKSIEIKIS